MLVLVFGCSRCFDAIARLATVRSINRSLVSFHRAGVSFGVSGDPGLSGAEMLPSGDDAEPVVVETGVVGDAGCLRNEGPRSFDV